MLSSPADQRRPRMLLTTLDDPAVPSQQIGRAGPEEPGTRLRLIDRPRLIVRAGLNFVLRRGCVLVHVLGGKGGADTVGKGLLRGVYSKRSSNDLLYV